MNYKLESGYVGNIVIPEGFIRAQMLSLNEAELKTYITVTMLAQTKSKIEFAELASMLKSDIAIVINSLQVLEKLNLVKLSTTSVTVLSTEDDESAKPVAFREYTPEEISAMHDDEIAKLTRCAEKTYGKLLSYAEISVLISLYKFIGISSDVLTVLIEYTGSLGKKTMAYLKNAALDWQQQGIDNAKKAHEYITYLEQQKNFYATIKDYLGIYGREFTKKEREYLDKWSELKLTAEEIKDAYERTIDATGKIAFGYMNKILTADEKPEKHSEMLKTPAKKVKSTSFNNFNARERNFDDIKRKAKENLKNKRKKEEV